MNWIKMTDEKPIPGDVIAVRHTDALDHMTYYLIGDVAVLAIEQGVIDLRFISNAKEIYQLDPHWDWLLIEKREQQLEFIEGMQ